MSNPNKCQHCGHKQHPDDGWCYMFRMEPKTLCAHHTLSSEATRAIRLQIVKRILETQGASHE